MFYKLSDFQKEWAVETEATIKLLKVLTDKSLEQKVNKEGRTLGRLAWHMVCSLSKTELQAELPVKSVPDETLLPVKAKEVLDQYEISSKEVIENIIKYWTDDSLEEEIPMFRDKWRKGMVLTILIKHQTHHRAQMTILMRQAGLIVPGIYGPSREEWELLKMPSRE